MKNIIMKGIYLASYKALHPDYDIVYQDINGKRDLSGDMMGINLYSYDFIIATPPCNYWSKARGNRCSQYSLDTKHLLPDILYKLCSQGKPFIVENVKNRKRFLSFGLYDFPCQVFEIGRHTYWTNVFFDKSDIEELNNMCRQDFKYGGKVILYDDMKNKEHQGGYNVHIVVEKFLEKIHQGGKYE